MYNAIVDFLGVPPSGTESIVYIFCMLVTIFLLNSVVTFIFTMFRGTKR